MLQRSNQIQMSFSKYSELYDILISKDNEWRKLNEIDFSFVYNILEDSYSEEMGRTATDVVFMFKLLLIKDRSGLSDVGVINKIKVDMEYKYFLGLEPEETEMIDSSLLTKFRRTRLAKYEKDENGKIIKVMDKSEELLDALIAKSVEIALDKGVIKKKNIGIVDSTHTLSIFGHVSPREKLIQVSKKLRKSIYQLDSSMKEKMPKKREASGLIEDEILYCNELLEVIEKDGRFLEISNVEENINLLKEVIEDTEIELEYSKDSDAKIGHKTADTEFFGYKTHLMMSEERIITASKITTGEKNDGKQLETLIEKTQKNGIELEAVIGDGAYSEEKNLNYCEDAGIKNVSKLSKMALYGNQERSKGFEFNKDAGMFVCPAGHMSIKKAHNKGNKSNNYTESDVYFFDVDKCKRCPFKEGCYKEGAKSKSYSQTIEKEVHSKQKEFMETEEFKEYYSHRYKIEAKNAELKHVYNYDKSNACGLSGITIQGATTLFLANMKRIYKLEAEKKKEIAR